MRDMANLERIGEMELELKALKQELDRLKEFTKQLLGEDHNSESLGHDNSISDSVIF